MPRSNSSEGVRFDGRKCKKLKYAKALQPNWVRRKHVRKAQRSKFGQVLEEFNLLPEITHTKPVKSNKRISFLESNKIDLLTISSKDGSNIGSPMKSPSPKKKNIVKTNNLLSPSPLKKSSLKSP